METGMNLWIVVAVVIESMACLGILGILVEKNTRPAFLAGFNTMLLVTGTYVLYSPQLNARAIAVLAMVAVYLVRMNWLLLAWQKYTAVPKLNRKLSASEKYFLSFILANIVGWGYCLPFYFAVMQKKPLDTSDLFAFAVYVAGTIIHFGSDYQKQRFKRSLGSKGKLLKTGFWALCRHPNYFGDFLIYVAFGLIGHSIWGWISPLLNLLQYLFDAIPKNEKWAAERYGNDWQEYAGRTKRLIPYIY
jgi:steroid 5-alpha reductase family enzyme